MFRCSMASLALHTLNIIRNSVEANVSKDLCNLKIGYLQGVYFNIVSMKKFYSYLISGGFEEDFERTSLRETEQKYMQI